jgi:hypothetical protein
MNFVIPGLTRNPVKMGAQCTPLDTGVRRYDMNTIS